MGDPGENTKQKKDDVVIDGKPRLHQWWLVEMRDNDKETPILYGRTKGRKNWEITAPWVEPDMSRKKPQNLPLQVYSIWNVMNPGITPETLRIEKWLSWVAAIAFLVVFVWKAFRDDDDFGDVD